MAARCPRDRSCRPARLPPKEVNPRRSVWAELPEGNLVVQRCWRSLGRRAGVRDLGGEDQGVHSASKTCRRWLPSGGVRDAPTLSRTARGWSRLGRCVPDTCNADRSEVALLPKELRCHIYVKDFVTLSGQRPRLGPGPSLGRISAPLETISSMRTTSAPRCLTLSAVQNTAGG